MLDVSRARGCGKKQGLQRVRTARRGRRWRRSRRQALSHHGLYALLRGGPVGNDDDDDDDGGSLSRLDGWTCSDPVLLARLVGDGEAPLGGAPTCRAGADAPPRKLLDPQRILIVKRTRSRRWGNSHRWLPPVKS